MSDNICLEQLDGLNHCQKVNLEKKTFKIIIFLKLKKTKKKNYSLILT